MKVLIVITTAFVPTGGLTTVMMNYYRKIDKSGLHIDFASNNDTSNELINELSQNNSDYFCLGKRSNILTYFQKLYQLCKGYEVIHINGNSATVTIELVAAWLAGVKVRIVHNHTTRTQHRIVNMFMKPLFRHLYTKGLACSEDAGNWLFGPGKFSVMRNAIDAYKYSYNESDRYLYRKKLNIPQSSFVLGHVGKIYEPKNHKWIVSVFAEYCKKHKDVFLLIVGDGILRTEIEQQIEQLGMRNNVIITGLRTDIPQLLSAMDFFIFPSIYEGLGLAVIEAQASGLPCLVSDRVPQDVYISPCVYGMSLDHSSAEWVSMIEQHSNIDRNVQSQQNIKSITNAGYNIETETRYLRQLYLE